MSYETVIGLETHAQLLTSSKMFCACSASFGAAPNTNICPICTGQPGVLPVMNKKAIELAIKTALALNCKIEPSSNFARKHYFYPDLPKNFQISQYDLPLATGGYLDIEVDGTVKRIGITRVHLEEDAGKLVHVGAGRIMGADESLVDYNRTGVPLMEIVSEPDLRSPKEAMMYMQTLAALLRYIEVCDAKLEEGSLRCDANLSVRQKGDTTLGVKTEVKNMNSFKAVEKALQAEEKRHLELTTEGTKIIQETRFFDETTNLTSGMRGKEFAHDYRYFPEPDLVPIEPPAAWIEEIRRHLGELPQPRRDRFVNNYHLPLEIAEILVADKKLANFFEETIPLYDKPTIIAHWLIGEITAFLNENKASLAELNFTPAKLAELLLCIDRGTLSGTSAKTILQTALRTGQNIADIISETGMTQISDTNELLSVIKQIIKNNPKQVEQYKAGKETVLMFFVGQVMRATKGKANPELTQKLVKEALTA